MSEPNKNESLSAAIQTWIDQAKGKLANGGVSASHLDELSQIVSSFKKTRQRLIYAQASAPTPQALIMAYYPVEPVMHGASVTLTPNPKFPYQTIHEAMMDGWQIVKFPETASGIQDREIDVQGYQFILQKLEVYRD